MERVLFCLAFFGAYTLQAITGFAGNLFAMPAGVATIGMGASMYQRPELLRRPVHLSLTLCWKMNMP